MPPPMKDYLAKFASNNNPKVLPPKSPMKGGFHAYDHPSLASTASVVGGRRSRRSRKSRRRGGCGNSNLALTAAPVGGRRSKRSRKSRRSRRGGGEVVPYPRVNLASTGSNWNSGLVL